MATATSSDGTLIVYTTSGDSSSTAPAIVLVHGITESRASWGPVVPLLEATHHVVALDLRGHGESGTADRYDLEAMAGDVAAVAIAAGLDRPHLVGHSLGGAVVSAVGAALPVTSVVNVDQSLRLGGFKEALMPAESMLKDPATFDAVIGQIFVDMAGTMLSETEAARITALRRADQQVVLGVWELLFSMSVEEIDGVVESVLAGYAGKSIPYLSLFGIDPGDDYADWIGRFIDGATVELWADHGHYPHLVDPERFVARLNNFWVARQ